MFENRCGVVEEVAAVAVALASPAVAVDDHERIERIKALDGLAAAVAAARAVQITDFAESQQAAQRDERAADRDGARLRRARVVGVAEQVALARRVSPGTGARQVSAARVLVRELPRTHRLLAGGAISEWTATLVVNGSSGLDVEDRAVLDTELEPQLPGLGPRAVEAAVRRAAIGLDPDAALRRSGLARRERRVWTRPAPDTMAVLSGCVPVEQGVAAYAALDRTARALRAGGDSRSLDQIRADEFIARLTGQTRAEAISFEVGVTMSTGALLNTGETPDEPADIAGHGPIPAALARDLLTATDRDSGVGGAADRVRVFLRRLFTDPTDGTVTGIDTRRRRFGGAVARYLRARDQFCRTPGCEAPIAHLDHAVPHRAGGPTSAANGQGLCEACSYTKEAPGWSHGEALGLGPDGQLRQQATLFTTPTGHTYESRPPPAGPRLPRRHAAERRAVQRPARTPASHRHPRSATEHALSRLVAAQPP